MNSKNLLYEVSPKKFEKEIAVPTSKSYANRLLILAAIDSEPIKILDIPKSNDVKRMIDCLQQTGLKISHSGRDIIIHNSFPSCEASRSPLNLETGDGGTTNRFLLPFLARGKRVYRLNPYGYMKKRPMEDLIHSLNELGAKISTQGEDYWIEVQGPLPLEGKTTVNCEKSTQFATAMLLACADRDIKFHLENFEVSKKYFELSEKLVSEFRRGNIEWRVPADFSGLSYPLALALTSGHVLITNCFFADPFQADSEFLTIIQEMGGKLEWSKEGLRLSKPEKLNPIDRDGSTCPDLIPTLAYVCSYAEGISTLRNLEVLRHKECDRVEEILNILKHFEVKYRFDEETHTLTIDGSTQKVPYKEYKSPEDHRMIMTAYLFMRHNSGGLLHNAEHVSKSFPNFFEIME